MTIEQPVCIGLGSNLGDRDANLREALARMQACVRVERTSTVYETEPVDYEAQGWFLNMAVRGLTALTPRNLLQSLQSIENVMGRTRSVAKGPRIIDLDILFYSTKIIDTAKLTVPHPELHRRAFVLAPLAEIAPEWVHPVLHATVQELYLSLAKDKVVQPWIQNG